MQRQLLVFFNVALTLRVQIYIKKTKQQTFVVAEFGTFVVINELTALLPNYS
jgi:hypothetical protein